MIGYVIVAVVGILVGGFLVYKFGPGAKAKAEQLGQAVADDLKKL